MKTKSFFLAAIVWGIVLVADSLLCADEMPWVVVSQDKTGFVLESSGKPFVPWGFRTFDNSRIRMVDMEAVNLDAKEIKTILMKGGEEIEDVTGKAK